MIIRTLETTSIDDLLSVFNKSFENYFIPFKLSKEQLEGKIKLDNIQLDLSAGMFDKDKLIGFILHGLDATNKYVYNGGTGVIDTYRGNGITSKLYEFIIPILKNRGVTHSKLEVVKENIVAKRIYEKQGFEVERLVSCMRTNNPITSAKSVNIEQVLGDEIITDAMESTMIPTWQSSIQSINFQREKLVQYVVKDDAEIIGNLILNGATNRILRLNVKKDRRRQGIGNALLSHASGKNANLSVLNLDETNKEVIGFFKSQGFEVSIQQYEMLKDLYK